MSRKFLLHNKTKGTVTVIDEAGLFEFAMYHGLSKEAYNEMIRNALDMNVKEFTVKSKLDRCDYELEELV